MSPAIKKVALAGATGNLGPAILTALLDSQLFEVTVLTRKESTHKFPSHVTVQPVDYTSLESITAALQGQDALVSTLAAVALESQKLLVDACISAGVQRFLPSEFGSDTTNPLAAKLPVFGGKVAVQQYLANKVVSAPQFSYTLLINNAFLDWGLQVGFLVDVKGKKAQLKDGGDVVFCATTLASVGQGVVGVLSHPAETANRAVYIKSADVTQNQLIAAAQKADPSGQWEITDSASAALEQEGLAALAQGDYSMGTLSKLIYRAIYGQGYGGHYTTTDNALLGIKELDAAGVEALVREIVES
ncbi:hypothetical protein BP5796_00844 [Coleophoma crateriformis]|uniref:NmrA-like domain-containing protein n=1 Tax=Coleophoma crateriformis TaxID=565419 RepID=A0A3D8T9H0_9HELO|nr:hypothetical protein BP5796_00844 [Coleophoma crateriformis]